MPEPQSVTVLDSIGGDVGGGGQAPVSFPRLREAGVVVLRRFMSPDAARALAQELVARRTRNDLSPDTGVPGAFSAYADPFFQVLLLRAKAILEPIVAAALHPTYSYARVYARGCDLPAHVDREACEVSISLALGSHQDRVWPFWAEFGGTTYQVRLAPGDAVLYLGHECRHWREALENEWSAHLFLHYVFRDGPWADYQFDETPRAPRG